MLVLSRRKNEALVLVIKSPTEGHPDVEIRVMVTEVSRQGVVRLGFDADKSVVIWREEIYPDKG
jgi:carbon storage regulator CsrA